MPMAPKWPEAKTKLDIYFPAHNHSPFPGAVSSSPLRGADRRNFPKNKSLDNNWRVVACLALGREFVL